MKKSKSSNHSVRNGLLILTLILLASLITVSACSGPKVYKVGILSSFPPFGVIADALKSKLTELGYIEGKNIIYDYQVIENNPQGEKDAIQKFINEKNDLIFTFPTQSSVTASEGTKGTKMPVVFAMCGVEDTLPIESTDHPGGNLTGVRYPGPDNTVKHLELMLEIKPNTKTIWVTYDISYPNTQVMLKVLRPACKEKNVTLIEAPGKTGADVQKALDALVASGDYKKIDGMLLLPEALSMSNDGFGAMIAFANKYKIQVGAGIPPMMEAGVTFCLLPDNAEMGKLAAPLVDKIFKGADPGSLPLITPENYLFINYKKITELGLTVPEGLLKQAIQVIK